MATFSYYQKHKEGGVTQTLLAVLNSFNTVADAYSSVDGDSLMADLGDYDLEKGVLDALESVENGETQSVSGAVLKSILSERNTPSAESDILAMEGEDGEFPPEHLIQVFYGFMSVPTVIRMRTSFSKWR